jgi:glycosyltransferase involved in cell wall biosynthesis
VASIETFLEAEGRDFDLCVVSRPPVAEQWLGPLRAACPRARLVFDAADLMTPAAFAAGLARARRNDGQGAFAADGFLGALEPTIEGSPDAATCALPRIYDVSEPSTGFASRRGLLLVTGFQAAPDLDGLLFLLDEVLARVSVAPTELRVHVPEAPWTRGLAGLHGLSLVSESQGSARRFYEGFRLAVAPTRFGAALSGRLLPAMAAGLPCVASPVAARDLAPEVRAGLCEARDGDAFVRVIEALSTVEPAWLEASRRARGAVARRYAYETMRERVRTLLARLGFAVG